MPGPLADLQVQLAAYALRAPGQVALAVQDVATGVSTGFNAGLEMPAASTIKIPVMVEVFRQLVAGNFDLNTRLHVQYGDRDWGSGELCDAPRGATYPVSRLLSLMIDDSDNTATNMLIRLVGRQSINASMLRLGLTHTRLNDFIRSNGPIRRALRSSPADMVHLLDAMAKERLIDEWSSRQMIAILTEQHINTLLPVPLPPGTTIAHKTGSLHDTLNDVGIVYAGEDPYVIAVMTTGLSDLDSGRTFIRGVSRMAYTAIGRFNTWRAETGFGLHSPATAPAAADATVPAGVNGDGANIAVPAAVATAAPLTPAAAPDVKMWTPTAPAPAAAAGQTSGDSSS
ncbi:MAG TPA: serine hydrolase [Candidatus Acidoferrum sp.]|nr:serine hydrolase [Candidatus Acidoferrum sp.]